MAELTLLEALQKMGEKIKIYVDDKDGSTGVQSVNGLSGDVSVSTPNDIPMLFLSGDTTDMTKDNAVVMGIQYFSPTQNFDGYVNIKWQGQSSLSAPKKNYTIKIYEDEACENKQKVNLGWGKQSKYCLKSYYMDHSQARGVVSAKLWGEIVGTREDYVDLPANYAESPNNLAVDGYPIKLYINGNYNGMYALTIPKDAWMLAMDETTGIVLQAGKNNQGDNTATNATEFRSLWDAANDWGVEIGTLTDIKKNSFNALINFVMTATDAEFYENLKDYADVNSFIDYYIFIYALNAIDDNGNNMLMIQFDDSDVWHAGAYDLDTTWGVGASGTTILSAENPFQSGYFETNSLLWIRMEKCFRAEIKARYATLRSGVLSLPHIIRLFEQYTNKIPYELFAEDVTLFPNIPLPTKNNLSQIRSYAVSRLAYVDACINALGKTILSISAVYSGDAVESDSDINILKDSLAVTGLQEDGDIATITDYILSGTIADGENVITVTYGELTTTFTVTGQTTKTITSITAVANTTSYPVGTDASELNLTVTANYSDGTSSVISGYSVTGTVAVDENTFTITYKDFSTTVAVTGYETISAVQPNEDGTFNVLGGSPIVGQVLEADGSTSSSNSFITTDYLDISSFSQVSMTCPADASYILSRNHVFDAEGNWLTRIMDEQKSIWSVAKGATNTFTVQDGWKYLRFSGSKNQMLDGTIIVQGIR